jgi:hypothetical protein
VVDPDYDPDYCGFNDFPGCIPLNGCGSIAMFPFLLSFILVVSFIFCNLFISVVLEGTKITYVVALLIIILNDYLIS